MLKRLQTASYEKQYKIEIFEKSTSAIVIKLGQNVFCSVSRLKNQIVDNPAARIA